MSDGQGVVAFGVVLLAVVCLLVWWLTSSEDVARFAAKGIGGSALALVMVLVSPALVRVVMG